jgi:hypothetical protein
MTIEHLRRQIRDGKYNIAFTHTEKLRRRRISLEAIEQAVLSGEIIESYADDPLDHPAWCSAGPRTHGRSTLFVVTFKTSGC